MSEALLEESRIKKEMYAEMEEYFALIEKLDYKLARRVLYNSDEYFSTDNMKIAIKDNRIYIIANGKKTCKKYENENLAKNAFMALKSHLITLGE